MKRICSWLYFLVLAGSVFGQNRYEDPNEFGLEPAIVPDTVDGVSRWWYTPSRKAYVHRHKYPITNRILFKSGENLRLPGNILPRSYNIRLLPFIQVGNWTTDGYVEIFVDCMEPIINLSMNSLDLIIDKASITVTPV